MNADRALLTFSIGPVQSFIAQARRVADLWAGSDLLSHLVGAAIDRLHEGGGELVFPAERSAGFPNRFVADVPLDGANALAKSMAAAVRGEWEGLVERTVALLAPAIVVDDEIWDGTRTTGRQTDALFEVAWSFVPLTSYAEAARVGAAVFASSRLFRPFVQISEQGEKCAVCGERTALPNGKRDDVGDVWKKAAEPGALPPSLAGFLRVDQTRLCLVCSTKRFFPHLRGQPARFLSFQDFEPPPIEEQNGDSDPRERLPYFALVALDGDHMGRVLGWSDEIKARQVHDFHRALSGALSRFAADLRAGRGQDLNLAALGLPADSASPQPQLIYAGGDDVLLVSSANQALSIAEAVRRHYVTTLRAAASPYLASESYADRLTTSGAILYAHTRHPAGLLFRDLHDLLERKAKAEGGRDALAIKLMKRGGVPVEVALRWDPAPDRVAVPQLRDLLRSIREPGLASRQTFFLRDDERLLQAIFGREGAERWQKWLAERLSRGGTSASQATELARALTPFFVHQRTEALRIARFLAREVGA